MRIYAQVVPRSSKKEVKRSPTGDYKVWLTAPPVDGKANKQLIEVFSKYFKVSKSSIEVVGGRSARMKLIDIGGINEDDV